MGHGHPSQWRLRSKGLGLIFNTKNERPLLCKSLVGVSFETNQFDGWLHSNGVPFSINSTRTRGNYLEFSQDWASFDTFQGQLIRMNMRCFHTGNTFEMYIKFEGSRTYFDTSTTYSPPTYTPRPSLRRTTNYHYPPPTGRYPTQGRTTDSWNTGGPYTSSRRPYTSSGPYTSRSPFTSRGPYTSSGPYTSRGPFTSRGPYTSRGPFTTRRINTYIWTSWAPVTNFPPQTTHHSVVNSQQQSSPGTGTIVGSTIGGLVALIILIVLIYICYMKRRQREPRSKLQNEDSVYKRQRQQNPYITNDKAQAPWDRTASNAFKIPEDPKRKETEEAIILAMKIIQERQSKKIKPDVVPSYIKNRPVPQVQNTDPRPKIGPLSKSGGYEEESQDLYVDPATGAQDDAYSSLRKEDCQENLYLDLAEAKKHGAQPIVEEQYLDLDQAKEEYMKTMMIEPDDTC